HKVWKQADGKLRLVVEGLGRFRIVEVLQASPFLRARVERLERDGDASSLEAEALARSASSLLQKVVSLSPTLPDEMANVGAAAGEYAVARTDIDWLVAMPWRQETTDTVEDLASARSVLDADHEGLEKIKERILEYLAIKKLRPSGKDPILCFVGPPGVGKTSLGRSIARALGRKFHRISLGGIRDEAEIRGHRRTYVGALPGQIIQGLRRAGTKNPVFMLDEIDKLGMDFRGDPASALLEVLDPEQTGSLRASFLGVPRFEFEELEERTRVPGVSIGLAWTPAGGDILFVEATRMKGKGGLTLTGQLGDVMKESAQAALSWVRSHAAVLGIAPDFWETSD